MGTYSTKGDEVIRDSVFRKAQDLESLSPSSDIKVQRMGGVSNAPS